MADDTLATLRTLPTPNLSDALEQLGFAGAMRDIGPLAPELPRMAGYARTIRQGPRAVDAERGRSYIRHTEIVDARLKADEVLVIGIEGNISASSWGALLSLRCQKIGAAGTVIDGSVRDPLEIARSGYPVFRRPTFSPAGSKLRLATLEVDVPVNCGGVLVAPGAMVVGDDSGVVVIPASHAEKVIELAKKILAKESEIEHRIQGGGSFF